MNDIIIILVLLGIVSLATWYIIRAKKNGKKCIGCPEGCCTSKKDGESCCCGCNKESN